MFFKDAELSLQIYIQTCQIRGNGRRIGMDAIPMLFITFTARCDEYCPAELRIRPHSAIIYTPAGLLTSVIASVPVCGITPPVTSICASIRHSTVVVIGISISHSMAQVHANWTDGHRGISRQTLMTRVHFNDYSFLDI